MRFLLGLCFGAALVLGISIVLERLQGESALTATAPLDSVATPPAMAIDDAELTTPSPDFDQRSPSPAPNDARMSIDVADPSDSDEQVVQPEMQRDETLVEVASTPHSEPAPTPTPTPPEIAAAITMEQDTALESATQTSAAPEAIAAESTTVSVWQPFHSEMSAQGFAKRLTLQLGYPFSVLKAGPAEYHVVFSYEADSQRELLSSQLANLTGATPR